MPSSGSDGDTASRPMQLPKVGWDDDDDDDDSVGVAGGDDTNDNAVELGNISSSMTRTKSDEGITQRVRASSPDNGDLEPIPEDYSMHGDWPDYYSDLCRMYNDYDDRSKEYRYRFCRRLCEDRRYRLTGIILIVAIVVVYSTSFSSHREGKSSAAKQSGQESGLDEHMTKEELEKREESEHYKTAALTYHPRYFSRKDSEWTGTTYFDAVNFCSQNGDQVPCPYEAYCPMGVRRMPLGGFKDEPDGSWAPFLHDGSINEWVSLSSANPCEKYSTTHSEKPSWGWTGVNSEKFTRHIACCLNVEQTAETTSYEGKSSDSIARPPLLEEDAETKVTGTP